MNEVIFEAWPNDAGIELLQSYKYLNQSIKQSWTIYINEVLDGVRGF